MPILKPLGSHSGALKRRGTTNSNPPKDSLDRLFTSEALVDLVLDAVDVDDFDVVIEPSAGSGAFSNRIPDCLALDLEPASPGIRKQDFLTFEPDGLEDKKVLVIGNPPFGRNLALAVRFINHAVFADTIAFILPPSARKESVLKRINPYLHLRQVIDLPSADAFILNGKPYSLPAALFIFERYDRPRPHSAKPETQDFTFTRDLTEADFAVQRVGGNAGRAKPLSVEVSRSSHYFVAARHPRVTVDLFNTFTYPSRDWTVGPRSISQSDIIRAYLDSISN